MNADWQAGDLALCVHDPDWSPAGIRRAPNQCSPIKTALAPRKGSIWRVLAVELHRNERWHEKEVLFLKLEGQPSDIVHNSQNFVKISASAADAEDRETIGIMCGEEVVA